VRATSSAPDVSRSSRCTSPQRPASPTPTSSGYRASNPPARVPVVRPAPGWTVSPAGLSTTTNLVVLVEHAEVDGLGRQTSAGTVAGNVIVEPAATRDLATATSPSTVTCPSSQWSASLRPGHLTEHGDDLVDPLAVELLGNGDRQRLRHAATNRTATPNVMEVSARLKTGKFGNAIQSITGPSNSPSPRARRSIRLPAAPPAIRESPTTSPGTRAPQGGDDDPECEQSGQREKRAGVLEEREGGSGVLGVP
jgi:hypothetical protein